MGLGSGIRDPGSGIWKKPIPDPGFRGQKGTGSRIPDPDPQHCRKLSEYRNSIGIAYLWPAVLANSLFMDQKKQLTFIKPMQSRICWKKCVNVSGNSKGLKKNYSKARHATFSGLDLSIYVIKSLILLVRLSY